MVTDESRRNLYTVLEERLGREPATTMMELLPPVGWADVARQSDLVALRGEMAEVRGEMAEVRGEMAEVRGEMATLGAELRAEMATLGAELRGEMAEVRNEVAELRATISAQVPRLYFANAVSGMGIAGLVLAAATFVS